MKKVLSGAQAIAYAVKICRPAVIAAYPITPQTGIMETITQMSANGEIDAEIIRTESEHSAMAACIGAQATGVRSYTATASQGLAYMHELLFIASGMRLPIVMAVANRALSSPLNIWNDQQDSVSERDSGWVQLYVENAQEAFDTQIQAFKIAESINLPVMVCLDGYVVSHTYEPIQILEADALKKYLSDYIPDVSLNPTKPITLGALATPEWYIKFRKQQQEAMEKANEAVRRVNREFFSAFGRIYGNGLIETMNLETGYAIVTMGSVTGTVRAVLEKEGIGLIRIRCLRPFPKEEIMKACAELKGIGILEKAISIGANGPVYDEIRSALYALGNRPKVSGYIAGLGGRDITQKDIEKIIASIKSGKEGVEWVM